VTMREVTRPPSFFGWKVVRAAFLVAAFSWGVGFYGPSVFLQTLHAERGWAISSVSAAITAHFLFSAMLVTCLPEAHRRFGIARVTQAGVAFAALGILAWSNAREPWQLFAAALPSGAGWAATSGAAINAMVAPWFERDRPKALSLAFNGASIGGLVFVPLWVVLIARFGLPSAAALIGLAMAAVLWPLAAKYLRPKPEAAGSAESEPQAEAAPRATRRVDLLRDRRFATISGAFALGLFAQIGIFAHLLVRLAPELGPSGSAWAISLTTVCAVAGRTILGWGLGSRDRRLAASLQFRASGVRHGAAGIRQRYGRPALRLYPVRARRGQPDLPPLIVQKEFAAADTAKAVALITAINQAVFAFAPAVLGWLRDVEADYTLPFGIAACLQIAASLLVLGHRSR
jgi:MFS family permease